LAVAFQIDLGYALPSARAQADGLAPTVQGNAAGRETPALVEFPFVDLAVPSLSSSAR
jgi:hypothetical protein